MSQTPKDGEKLRTWIGFPRVMVMRVLFEYVKLITWFLQVMKSNKKEKLQWTNYMSVFIFINVKNQFKTREIKPQVIKYFFFKNYIKEGSSHSVFNKIQITLAIYI